MTKQEINKIIEKFTDEYVSVLHNNCAVLDGGFTPEELRKIADLIEQCTE